MLFPSRVSAWDVPGDGNLGHIDRIPEKRWGSILRGLRRVREQADYFARQIFQLVAHLDVRTLRLA